MSVLPRYRVWAGLTIWLGSTAVAFVLVASGTVDGDLGGWLSLAGFVVAFGWAQAAPR